MSLTFKEFSLVAKKQHHELRHQGVEIFDIWTLKANGSSLNHSLCTSVTQTLTLWHVTWLL